MFWLSSGIVSLTVLVVFWLDRQETPWIKKVLEWFPAILFAYVIPALITHLFGLDLSQGELHQSSKNIIIPLAILLVMSALSFRQLRIVGWRPILLFVFGSFVIAVLAPVLEILSQWLYPDLSLLVLDEAYWKGLAPIVGGWIGGSTSQLVLKVVVECPEGLFLSILVLDNILVNIWTILMFQMIKRSDQLNAHWGIEDKIRDFVPDEVQVGGKHWQGTILTVTIIFLTLLLTVLLVDSFLGKIIVLSVIGLFLGNLIPQWNHALVLRVGGVLIVLIMAILGLRLDFGGLSLPWSVVVLVIVWLILHYVFMLLMARWLRLHMAWVPIASMANLGGISTAPAVTAAYNEEWMPHAIVLAILSMVSGTSWGLLTIYLFQLLAA